MPESDYMRQVEEWLAAHPEWRTAHPGVSLPWPPPYDPPEHPAEPD